MPSTNENCEEFFEQPSEHRTCVDYDLFHDRLITLLDQIETEHDSSLAKGRFEIIEEFGYEIVLSPNPNGGMKQ